MDPVSSMSEETFKVVLQGGSFAVLVAIAFFMMKSIPAWINAHLQTVTDLAKTHKEEATSQQDMFAKQLAVERAMCDRHHENVLLKLEQSNATTLAAFQSMEKSIDKHHEFAVATMAALQDSKKT